MVRCDLRTDIQEACVFNRLEDLCDQNLSTILGSISEGTYIMIKLEIHKLGGKHYSLDLNLLIISYYIITWVQSPK